MLITDRNRTIKSLNWRGQFGAIADYKSGVKTADEVMADNPRAGIYQTKHTADGPMLSQMRLYRPTNPQTPLQQANRVIFASGVTQWQSLTTEEKLEYTNRAKSVRLTGFNLFMREWLNSHI